jgi:hypothetical protein
MFSLRCLPGFVFIAGSSRRTPLAPGAGATRSVVQHCRLGCNQQLVLKTVDSGIRDRPLGNIGRPPSAWLDDDQAVALAIAKPLASADRIGLQLIIVANGDCVLTVLEVDDDNLILVDRHRVSGAAAADGIVDHKAHFDMQLADLPADILERHLDGACDFWPIVGVDDPLWQYVESQAPFERCMRLAPFMSMDS